MTKQTFLTCIFLLATIWKYSNKNSKSSENITILCDEKVPISWVAKWCFPENVAKSIQMLRMMVCPAIFYCFSVADYKKDESNRVRFFVRLCSDVLLEVLSWGNRRRLALLEKLGRCFHCFIDGRFEEKPFLLLDLHIIPWYIFYFQIIWF